MNTSRPTLPNSTPLPAGLRNPYESSLPPILTLENYHSPLQQNDKPDPQIVAQEKTMRSLVSKLPYALRENISSLLMMYSHQAQAAKQESQARNLEALHLGAELRKKSTELEHSTKTCKIFKERVRDLDKKVERLEEMLQQEKSSVIRNKKSTNRALGANKILRDTLDVLGGGSPATSPITRLTSRANITDDFDGLEGSRNRDPLTLFAKKALPTNLAAVNEEEELIAGANVDKLRGSLLRVSRQAIRKHKQLEIMEEKITELTAALEASKRRNIQFKIEIEDFEQQLGVPKSESAVRDTTNKDNEVKRPVKCDERIQVLIDKEVLDPPEAISCYSRLLNRLHAIGCVLDLDCVVAAITSRESCRIFDTEAICLFLGSVESDEPLRKYTDKSSDPEFVTLDESVLSVVNSVMKSNSATRLNALGHSGLFNRDIDCIEGIVPRRVMSVPLYDQHSKKQLGAINFINKKPSKSKFSEADVFFASIFAEKVASIVSLCYLYRHSVSRATLLGRLLEASIDIYSCLPENKTTFNQGERSLSSSELLQTLERIARVSLRCNSSRVFFASEALGLEPGSLILLDRSDSQAQKSKNNKFVEINTVGNYSGVVGLCMRSRVSHLLEGSELESIVNPMIDLDPGGLPLYTAPILDTDDTVIACIQLVAGPRSPPFSSSLFDGSEAGDAESQITFQQAAQWFLHQIIPPLMFLLGSIRNRRFVARPQSTPFSLRLPSKILSAEDVATGNETDISQQKVRRLSRKISVATFAPSVALGLGPIESKDVISTLHALRAMVTDGIVNSNNVPNARSDSDLLASLTATIAWVEATTSGIISARGGPESFVACIPDKPESNIGEQRAMVETLALTNTRRREEGESKGEIEKLREEVSSFSKVKSELASMQSTTTAQKAAIKELSARIDRLEGDKEQLRGVNDALNSDVDRLSAQLTEKESIISILQDQIVKLAGDNIKELDSVAMRAMKSGPSDSSKASVFQAISSSRGGTPATTRPDSRARGGAAAHDKIIRNPEAAPDPSTESAPESNLIVGAQMSHDNPVSSPALIIEETRRASANVPPTPTRLFRAPPATPPPPGRLPSRSVSRKPSFAATATGTHAASFFKKTLAAAVGAASEDAAARGDITDTTAAEASDEALAGITMEAGEVAFEEEETGYAEDYWREAHDDQGRKYYYNPQTGESSWELPDGYTGAVGEAYEPKVVGDWVQYFDPSGYEYWVNQISGESAWELPGQQQEHSEYEVGSTGWNDQSTYSATSGGYTIEL